MIRSGSSRMPAEVVILTATVLLALLTGAGAAFLLWTRLDGVRPPAALDAAVAAIALGVALVGLAVPGRNVRLFLWVVGGTFGLAFLLGAPVFALIP